MSENPYQQQPTDPAAGADPYAAQQPAYGQPAQPGYGTPDAAGAQGYPPVDPAAGRQGGYGYGAPTDPYGQQPGYGQPAQPGYGAPADPYGQQAQPGYGAPADPYGQQTQPGYGYGAPTDPYGQQPGYQQPYGAYGAQQTGYYEDPNAKSRLAAGLLGIFLGSLGIHRFYLGYTGVGVTMLLISVLSLGFLSWAVAIWGLVEGILYLTSKSGQYSVDSTGRPLRS
ncbi:NINE protein [Oerskovia sp. NPDC060338]|uniref:NINE protein n=1 Tax=Oerskovia sp. NPDC060338 TaxID=3347100 RepID=UPI003657870F